MAPLDTDLGQRSLAIGVLLEIAQDAENVSAEDRADAASRVIEATNPPYSGPDPEVDDATLNMLADKIAARLAVAKVGT